jgi:hypothetical protein
MDIFDPLDLSYQVGIQVPKMFDRQKQTGWIAVVTRLSLPFHLEALYYPEGDRKKS